uniref:Uncharacterized protein n=1 Tax=Knipowitschia caucasica TaxID=637954 RepID=A0AAV2K1U4_KNICA
MCESKARISVKNACGQTAADLARAQGFADCFQLISSLLQLHGAPGGQSQGSRKRLLGGQEHSRKKRAKADEDQQQQQQEQEHQQQEQQEQEQQQQQQQEQEQQQQEQQQQEQEHQQQQQQQQQDVCMDCGSLPDESPVFPSPESQSCGSLHVGDGSPDRWGPDRVGPWELCGGGEGSILLYGHYHGYGDTAEELVAPL